jgi:DNA-binding Xre family transcriptional regulator
MVHLVEHGHNEILNNIDIASEQMHELYLQRYDKQVQQKKLNQLCDT